MNEEQILEERMLGYTDEQETAGEWFFPYEDDDIPLDER